MYAVIYWVKDDVLFPVINENKTLMLFETLEEADEYAKKRKIDKARVISIEGVK